MATNPLLKYFEETVTNPLSRGDSLGCCSVKSLPLKAYRTVSVVISALGNFPFYAVSFSFGDRYSPILGNVVAVSEVSSYFLFQIKNLDDIRKHFFPSDPERALSRSEQGLRAEFRNISQSSWCSRNWRTVALQITLTVLGLLVQFPLMVLVYYGNNKNLIYPIIAGVSGASFTILSLIMSLKSFDTSTAVRGIDPELEDHRKLLEEQIDRFLAELPSKYKDPEFVKKIEEIFSDDPPKGEDERSRALLDLILKASGLPEIKRGLSDKVLDNVAKALGLLIAIYQTILSGAISYRSIIAWRPDQEALAVIAAVCICFANFKIFTKMSMDSAVGYCQGVRRIATKQFRPPLAHAVSPVAWYIGRVLSTMLSWLGCGTTGLAAIESFPEAGDALAVPAPLASALLLTKNLYLISDGILLWVRSQGNPNVNRFNHLNNALLVFRERVHNSPPEFLDRFFSSLLNFRLEELPSCSIGARDIEDFQSTETPLLEGRPATA